MSQTATDPSVFYWAMDNLCCEQKRAQTHEPADKGAKENAANKPVNQSTGVSGDICECIRAPEWSGARMIERRRQRRLRSKYSSGDQEETELEHVSTKVGSA